MLETIVIDLSEEWQKQAEKFSKRIQEAGKIPFCTQGKKEQTGVSISGGRWINILG